MNQGWIYREKVDRSGAGQSVLDYYSQRYRHSTRQVWQQRIEQGLIQLDGSVTTANTILRSHQQLAYHRPPWQEPEVPLTFHIHLETDDYLVIEKPSGLPVMPGGGFLDHTLLKQLEKQYPANPPIPIHRLGRGTSGLMLLARSPLAKSDLTRQMRDRQICKIYHAVVSSVDLPDCFNINIPIGKIPHPVLGEVFAAVADTQKLALSAHSQCRVLQRNAAQAIVEVQITTGRPHQIRIHLAAVGYPLLGDPLYQAGGGIRVSSLASNEAEDKIAVPGDCGYQLHAHHLTFTDPRSQHSVTVTSPTPFVIPPQATTIV
ncbi:MAG: RluA family pseudouridine synthase [Synechococcales bacterium]|nr:RluA family pseudouridine synthase [Synechococcales bacterium]